MNPPSDTKDTVIPSSRPLVLYEEALALFYEAGFVDHPLSFKVRRPLLVHEGWNVQVLFFFNKREFGAFFGHRGEFFSLKGRPRIPQVFSLEQVEAFLLQLLDGVRIPCIPSQGDF